jgi:hypothetical protein
MQQIMGMSRLSDTACEQRMDAGVVEQAWRAIGSPTAARRDPLDVGAVPGF